MTKAQKTKTAGRRTADTAASQRQNNRRDQVCAAAARLFAARGLAATSMRDIASASGMLPGSLYWHFPSKYDLFLQVHEDAAGQIAERVDAAIATEAAPWDRLEAAAAAHMAGMFEKEGTVALLQPVFPDDKPELSQRLKDQRDAYEARFSALVEALPLAPDVDRRLLRLMLLGSLNWSPHWLKRGSKRQSPEEIGRAFVRMIRQASGA